MRIDGPFTDLYKAKNFLIILVMTVFAVASGICNVYSKHKIRMLHVKLKKIDYERSMLNTEWSKLLLEKSTLMSDLRVEQIARNRLNMINPEQIYIIGQ